MSAVSFRVKCGRCGSMDRLAWFSECRNPRMECVGCLATEWRDPVGLCVRFEITATHRDAPTATHTVWRATLTEAAEYLEEDRQQCGADTYWYTVEALYRDKAAVGLAGWRRDRER